MTLPSVESTKAMQAVQETVKAAEDGLAAIGAKQYFEGDAGSNAGLAGADSEMYPYVSFTISIET